MADQRGMRFPQGGQGAYMNPGGQQYPMMSQQYPMMMPGMMQGGGNPAMQQQMMMQQGFQQGMFPGQMPQSGFVQQGMMPGMQQPGGQQFSRPPPPGYNPKMAQEYQAKHNKMMHQQKKLMESQQKKMAEAMKQKQFQDQQRKLKEFSTMGGRKMDADSLIHSILGPADKKKTSPPTTVGMQQPMGQFAPGMLPTMAPQQMANNVNANSLPQQAPPIQDDFADFGDFMEGPSASPSASPSATQLQEQQGNNQSVMTTQQNIIETPQVVETPAERAPENKKDLTSMMFESCDLTAPQKAKGFIKPSVKELQPQKIKAASFQVSQKARKWDGNTETLTELFTLPAQPVNSEPTPPPPATKGPIDFSVLPKWCSGNDDLPEIYQQVLEASIFEEKICVDRLYPILMRSGLQREVLGHIWTLANRHTPGELLKEELNVVLAMIAIAQNNLSIATTDILKKCPKPPVPFLGQTLPQQRQPESQGQQPVPPQTTHPPNSNNSAQHAYQAAPGVTPPVGDPNAEDDFADFQDATVSHSASFGDFTHASPSDPNKHVGGVDMMLQGPAVPTQQTQISNNLIGEEDKFSALRIEPEKKSIEVMPVFSPPVETKTEANEKSIVAKSESMLRIGEKLDVEFTADFAAFDDLDQKNNSGKTEEAPFANSTPALQDDFADFTSAPPALAGPEKKVDFADFQAATGAPSANSNAEVDKYAALKALISDTSLYEKKEEEKSNPILDTTENKESEDWATFQDASSSVSTENNVMTSDVIGSVSNGGLVPNLMPNSSEENKTDSGDWASFESAGPAVSNDTNWASTTNEQGNSKGFTGFEAAKKILGIKTNDTETKPSAGMSASSSSNQINTAKVHHFFARNVDQSSINAGTGMSPLDTAPPDIPDDIPDIPDDDDFDKFGTFRSGLEDDLGSSNDFGLSSLGAAYGGLDDITEIGSKKPTPKFYPGLKTVGSKSKDLSDTQSVSSNEFTGWKGSSKTSLKEDSQSVNSLDFNNAKKTSKEGSPSGVDSQSVSSLEFGVETGGGMKKSSSTSPQDQNSVASLDFKFTAQDSGKEEGDFGEFSSATNNAQSSIITPIANSEYIQNPRDIKDLHAAGSLPTIGGDRYSGFNESNEDTEDKHIHEWQRCLGKCSEMIGQANNTFNNISSAIVCTEVLQSEQGEAYLKGILEIYKVVCRINYSMEAASVSSAKLRNLIKQIDIAWNNLSAFLTGTPAMPMAGSLDFSKGMLKADMDEAQSKACGICLLDVNATSKAPNIDTDHYKLTYGGRQYHAPCANFWVNCVDSTLPSLKIPELL